MARVELLHPNPSLSFFMWKMGATIHMMPTSNEDLQTVTWNLPMKAAPAFSTSVQLSGLPGSGSQERGIMPLSPCVVKEATELSPRGSGKLPFPFID